MRLKAHISKLETSRLTFYNVIKSFYNLFFHSFVRPFLSPFLNHFAFENLRRLKFNCQNFNVIHEQRKFFFQLNMKYFHKRFASYDHVHRDIYLYLELQCHYHVPLCTCYPLFLSTPLITTLRTIISTCIKRSNYVVMITQSFIRDQTR